MFLYGYIGEMYKHIVQLVDISAVLNCAESTEPHLVSEKDICDVVKEYHHPDIVK